MIRAFCILMVSLFANSIIAQKQLSPQKELCTNLRLDYRNETFVIGLDNPLNIVYPQEAIITKEDIRAVFKHYKTKKKRDLEVFENNGHLFIRPDSLGFVTLIVNTIDGIKEKEIRTKTITAVGKLSQYRANHTGKIHSGEFRIQMGIIASIEGYDINARCAISRYDIIRLNKANSAERTTNQGEKFDKKSQKLITKADSGDLYIFRNILYKCPGDENEKRLDDMIFEIK